MKKSFVFFAFFALYSSFGVNTANAAFSKEGDVSKEDSEAPKGKAPEGNNKKQELPNNSFKGYFSFGKKIPLEDYMDDFKDESVKENAPQEEKYEFFSLGRRLVVQRSGCTLYVNGKTIPYHHRQMVNSPFAKSLDPAQSQLFQKLLHTFMNTSSDVAPKSQVKEDGGLFDSKPSRQDQAKSIMKTFEIPVGKEKATVTVKSTVKSSEESSEEEPCEKSVFNHTWNKFPKDPVLDDLAAVSAVFDLKETLFGFKRFKKPADYVEALQSQMEESQKATPVIAKIKDAVLEATIESPTSYNQDAYSFISMVECYSYTLNACIRKFFPNFVEQVERTGTLSRSEVEKTLKNGMDLFSNESFVGIEKEIKALSEIKPKYDLLQPIFEIMQGEVFKRSPDFLSKLATALEVCAESSCSQKNGKDDHWGAPKNLDNPFRDLLELSKNLLSEEPSNESIRKLRYIIDNFLPSHKVARDIVNKLKPEPVFSQEEPKTVEELEKRFAEVQKQLAEAKKKQLPKSNDPKEGEEKGKVPYNKQYPDLGKFGPN